MFANPVACNLQLDFHVRLFGLTISSRSTLFGMYFRRYSFIPTFTFITVFIVRVFENRTVLKYEVADGVSWLMVDEYIVSM